MAIHALASTQTLALAAPLLGWSVYRRVHRNIARQPLQSRRLAARGLIIAMIFALLAFYPVFDSTVAAALAAGCTFGVPLGRYGVRLTRFEHTAQGIFYTPNLYLGIAISLLFVLRMTYRCIVLWPALQSGDFSSFSSGERSPVTYATLGLVLGYFATYSLGVMRSARKLSTPG